MCFYTGGLLEGTPVVGPRPGLPEITPNLRKAPNLFDLDPPFSTGKKIHTRGVVAPTPTLGLAKQTGTLENMDPNGH